MFVPGMMCQEGKWFFRKYGLWCELTLKMRWLWETLNPTFVGGGRNSKFSKTFLIPEKTFASKHFSQQDPRGPTCF